MEDKALLSTEVASEAEKAELLIVIPAYNEAENIERVVNHLTANFLQYDYVVVNDGSRDETAAICQRNGYNLLNLPVNLGLAGAFQAGLKYADKYGNGRRLRYRHRFPVCRGEKAIYDADAWK